MSLAALHDWEIEALDVKTAYLFGELDEEIYMDQPESFIVKGQEKKVCRLKKSIYRLKQSALQWNKQLHKSLLEMKFIRCEADLELISRSLVNKSSYFSFTLTMLFLWVATSNRSSLIKLSL